MSPLLYIPLGSILAVCAFGGVLLVIGAWKRTGDDEIEAWIRTGHGRNLPPRSPSRKKRGW